MSQIDIQNAKQIRDPMTVLISMEVPEDVAVTYSDFTNVKIEDAQLGQRAWPMRQLADLQGEGFALDGSRVLYDPSVTASAANGKIGIRGDVGEDVTFTVSGDSNINGLSLAATGTDRVLFNGQTATFSDGQVIIPVGSDSITLTFPAEETDRRVEVSFTLPGTSLKVTNDSIISCIVSLRSDLSIEDPTLPESELNVDIYNDVDISEAVASIPDDSPLIYSAGYPGDMSPDRKFYVAGQITWADNVLSIHAVDAVHFLDKEFSPCTAVQFGAAWAIVPSHLIAMMAKKISDCGVNANVQFLQYRQYEFPSYLQDGTYGEGFVIMRNPVRDIVAFFNNVGCFPNLPNDALYRDDLIEGETHDFRFSYVDAGLPSLNFLRKSPTKRIYEEDCGEIKNNVEPRIFEINVDHKTESHTNYSYGNDVVGTVSWFKDKAGFVELDEIAISGYHFLAENESGGWTSLVLPSTIGGIEKTTPNRYYINLVDLRGVEVSMHAGSPTLDGDTPQAIIGSDTTPIYTKVVPWDAYYNPAERWVFGNTCDAVWKYLIKKGYIQTNDESFEITIKANKLVLGDSPKTYTAAYSGKSINLQELAHGVLSIGTPRTQWLKEVYPDSAYKSLLQRSNITGSFIWKGDPRMQPRDVVEFHRLDGTVEEITLENITLHHEGGGTYAEITYRKGVC